MRSLLRFFPAVPTLCLVLGWFTAPPAEAAKVEVEIWHRWSGPHQEILREALKVFEAKQPEIAVKDVSVPGQYVDLMQKVLARLAARQAPPDILAPGYNFFNYTVRELRPTPIDEIAGGEAKSVYDRYVPSVLKVGQVGGKQYGLPYALSAAVLYFNPKLTEAAGLNPKVPPKTWVEVRTWAEAIKQKTGTAPLFIATQDTFLTQSIVESAGGQLLQDGCPKFNSPEAATALDFWRKLYQDGLIPRIGYREAEQSFVAGDLAMSANSVMHLRGYAQQAKFPLGVAVLPRFGDRPLKSAAGGAALVVLTQNRERQRAAWELLKFLTSEEGMRIWTKTGYLNPLKVSLPQFEGQAPAYEQFPSLVGWVDWPGSRGLEVDKRVLNWRDKILLGEVPAKEGLEKAYAEVAPLLPGCTK
jgi:sn-glycerol 3-phosphate transport system substrate-binding protein